MIPDKAPKEDVLHGSEDLKKEAHISSFEKYKDLYLKSIENPDGKSQLKSSSKVSRSLLRSDVTVLKPNIFGTVQ